MPLSNGELLLGFELASFATSPTSMGARADSSAAFGLILPGAESLQLSHRLLILYLLILQRLLKLLNQCFPPQYHLVGLLHLSGVLHPLRSSGLVMR